MTNKNFLHSVVVKKERLAGAALLVLSISCLSAVLSYLKMYVTTSTFGATASYDAFLVALTLPEVVSNIFVGALGVVFIPLFSECISKDAEGAWDFLSSLLNWIFLFTTLLSFLLILLAPWVIKLIAPGLDEEAKRLSVRLMVIMVPIVMTMALSRLLMGFLQIRHNFSIPALGGVINLLVTILCILLLSKKWGIHSLAIGIVLGTLGRLCFQLPYAVREIKRYSLNVIPHPSVKRFVLAMVPIFLGGGVAQLGVVVERVLASHLPEGSISYLGYAYNLMSLPSEVFMGAIGTVLFPVLSQQAVLGNWEEFCHSFWAGVRMGNLVLIPMAVTFLFFGNLIIQVLFERGEFVASMTTGTARALAFYSIGMLALAPFNMAQYSYFALQRYWTAVKITLLGTSLGILLRVLLVKPMAYTGLALSASLTLGIYAIVMLWCLRDVLGGSEIKEVLVSFLKVFVSAVVAAFWASIVGSLLNQVTPIFQLSLILLTGAVFYCSFIYYLEVQEFHSLLELGKKFLNKPSAEEA
jgi:putative peptidoglycan lipid II flippase